MKIYSPELLKKKCSSLRAKVSKAIQAKDRADSMLQNLQKNKNLWKQFCEVNGCNEFSDIGDWMA